MKTKPTDLSNLLTLSPEVYLRDRVDDQMNWYDKKAVFNQKRYKNLKLLEIIVSVSLPFFTGLIAEGTKIDWKIVVGIMGVLVAGIEGVLSFQKYQENWLTYRTTAEQLKREKLLFQASAGHYRKSQDFPLFVLRCEQIMGKENASWFEAQLAEMSKKDKEDSAE